MKILVIGGTSFFGKDIVELALDAGHQVAVFSRGNQRPDFWERVDHISGDRTDKIDFAKKLANQQFDAVIDNIAFNREHVVNALNVFQGNIGRFSGIKKRHMRTILQGMLIATRKLSLPRSI